MISSSKKQAQNQNDELNILLQSLNNMESSIIQLPKNQNPYLKTQEDFNKKKQSIYIYGQQQSIYNSNLYSHREQQQKNQQNQNNSQAIKILQSNASDSQKTNYESFNISYATYRSNTSQNPEFNEKKEYIYKNLIFVLCALSDIQQTMNFFKSQDDKVYISISINRLIYFINLAGTVLKDYDELIKYPLQQEQQQAKVLFDEFCKQLAVPYHTKIEECITKFKQILSSEISNNIQQLQVNDNKKSIEWQTDSKDNEFQQAINNFKPGLTIKQDIDNILQVRRKRTQQLLENNFPQAKQTNIEYNSYFTS